MTNYRLTVALAETNDGHFPFLLREGSLTETGPNGQAITDLYAWSEPFEVEAKDVTEALDRVYAAANVGSEGWAARYRDGKQRSLSIGDVVRVEADVEQTSYWQVISHWSELDVAEVEAIWHDEPWDHEKSYERKKAVREEQGR